MLLTFSRDQFVVYIKNGRKPHTIREDKRNRWKPGNTIHFWRGNPRNTKANPYAFGTGVVSEVLPIQIKYDPSTDYKDPEIRLDGELLNEEQVKYFAWRDGFDSKVDFFQWFNRDFEGKVIYWQTDRCRFN